MVLRQECENRKIAYMDLCKTASLHSLMHWIKLDCKTHVLPLGHFPGWDPKWNEMSHSILDWCHCQYAWSFSCFLGPLGWTAPHRDLGYPLNRKRRHVCVYFFYVSRSNTIHAWCSTQCAPKIWVKTYTDHPALLWWRSRLGPLSLWICVKTVVPPVHNITLFNWVLSLVNENIDNKGVAILSAARFPFILLCNDYLSFGTIQDCFTTSF